MLSHEADLALVLSDKSPMEFERRMLPGKGVAAGDWLWMNVLLTMLSSWPSFHGDKLGSEGAAKGFVR